MTPQLDQKARRPTAGFSLRRHARNISAILCVVRISVFLILVLFIATALLAIPARTTQLPQDAAPQQAPPQPQQTPQSEQSVPPPPGAPAPAPVPNGPVIVIDPAHGGTDTGARGENALAEKDIVLQIARTVRGRLERQAYRVLMTRNDDSNPAFDDRAAIANAHRDVIFVSLHVASTGTPGTVRAYYDQLSSPITQQPAAATSRIKRLAPPSTNTLISWDQAQRPYLDASHHLADLIQIQLAQTFSGSPLASTAAPVRALRSVTGPAVAIEISSISGSSPDELTGDAGPLSGAIAKGISALRPSAEEVR